MAPLVMIEEKKWRRLGGGRSPMDDGLLWLHREDQNSGPDDSRRGGAVAGQTGDEDSNNEFKHRDSFE